MKKFIYKFDALPDKERVIIDRLNEYGKEGWQLVWVHNGKMFLKRETGQSEKQEQEVEKIKSDMDAFAIGFCGWYCHAPDAEVYKSQNLSAQKMIELYKSRPYLKTDLPEEN